MTDKKKIEFTITAGPSKAELIAALFFNAKESPHLVTFTLVPYGAAAKEYGNAPRVFEVQIDGVERESGCGSSWNLKGRIGGVWQDFSCYFDSTRRKGHFTAYVAS